MLKRPDFVTYDADGSLDAIYCKMCGVKIAGLLERPKGSGPKNTVMVTKFIRFPNYAEIKMIFDDISYCITNGCSTCLHEGMPANDLLDLYNADCAEQGMEPGSRKPVEVVTVDYTARGIV